MLRTLSGLLLVAALCSLAWGVCAQEAPGQNPAAKIDPPVVDGSTHDAELKIRVNSDLVVLPVTVKDPTGELVPDLQQKDFRIFDGQVEQSVDVFTMEAFPLSLVILIDDDLKSKDAAEMAPTLRAITGGISANDEALAARFDLAFYPQPEFRSDLNQLWADLEEIERHSGPSATTKKASLPAKGSFDGCACPVTGVRTDPGHRPTKALDDAIHSAAELLHDRGKARRKMVLIVTDGENGPQLNHHTYKDAVEALLRDNISVYSLAVGGGLNKQRRFSRLVSYADDTGGDIYFASTSAAIERLYSRITEQARHEYTLAYVPRGTDRNAPYHKVEVRVDRPGVTVKTRQGYYVNP